MKSRSHMKEHEQKCIKKPDSKSCITCKHLGMVMCLNGIALTKEENDTIIQKTKNLSVKMSNYKNYLEKIEDNEKNSIVPPSL